MDRGLSRKYRLPPQLISKVLEGGRMVKGRIIKFKYLPSSGTNSRLAIIVTKKYGKAVLRNRFRRLVREFFRLNRYLLKEKYDFVFLARMRKKGLKYQDLELELKELWEKWELISGNFG